MTATPRLLSDKDQQRAALVQRLFQANLAAYEIATIYLGDRLAG